jgi:hypothetical protein
MGNLSGKQKTSTDFIADVLNFFKDEYNKVKIKGLSYEYSLGENIHSDQVENGRDGYSDSLEAIEQLKNVGFIKEYKIIEKVEADGYFVWDYAVCKIDEDRLTQVEAPRATNEGVAEITKKVLHEHKHFFENNIQEKGIDFNHKYEKEGVHSFYVTKKDDDFYYKGRSLALSKKSDYYRMFCLLFAELPEGGEIKYIDLISKVKSSISKTKSRTDEDVIKFIQDNLTGKKNGFPRYAGIPETEDNGRPLVQVIRGFGIAFNNKVG